jgi:hypothetical protein
MYENLIVVCYVGGARGDAISHIIELSPDVYARNSKSAAVPNQQGSMASLITRYGHQSLDGTKPGWSTARYQDIKGIYWGFLDELPSMAAGEWQTIVPELWFDLQNRLKFKDALLTHRMVVADHANPQHITQLLPGAMTIAVVGDADAAFELFKTKHLFVKPERWLRDSPGYQLQTNLERYIAGNRNVADSPITDDERSATLQQIRASHHRRFDGMRQDTVSFALDFNSLFDTSVNQAVYHEMMAYLGLTPNWTAAREFIDIYNAAQPI